MKTLENKVEGSFHSTNGETIFYRNWNAADRPKAAVILVHGLNSHSGYYQNFAKDLVQNNYEVYALDLIGRGQSEGERYYIPAYSTVIEDIDQVVNLAKAKHPNIPVFLLGHSAGGVFASAYALKYQHKLSGLISESFAFQIPAPEFVLAIVKLLGSLIPHTQLIQLKNDHFSRNPDVVEYMNADPLIAHEKQPAKTMQQLLRAGAKLKKDMARIQLPLLVVHGTVDKATKYQGSQYFHTHAGSTDKELKLYEGHYHDLLNDKDYERVSSDLITWLNQRV